MKIQMNKTLTSLVAALLTVAYTNSAMVKAQPMSDYHIPEAPTFQLDAPHQGTPAEGSLIAPLSQNARAPFSGVLYNAEANAWLVAEINRIHASWRVEAEAELQVLQAWSLRELERLHNVALHNEEALNLRIVSLEADVVDLRELNVNLARQTGWTRGKKFVLAFTGAGSVIVGAVAGWLIGTFAR